MLTSRAQPLCGIWQTCAELTVTRLGQNEKLKMAKSTEILEKKIGNGTVKGDNSITKRPA